MHDSVRFPLNDAIYVDSTHEVRTLTSCILHLRLADRLFGGYMRIDRLFEQ